MKALEINCNLLLLYCIWALIPLKYCNERQKNETFKSLRCQQNNNCLVRRPKYLERIFSFCLSFSERFRMSPHLEWGVRETAEKEGTKEGRKGENERQWTMTCPDQRVFCPQSIRHRPKKCKRRRGKGKGRACAEHSACRDAFKRQECLQPLKSPH